MRDFNKMSFDEINKEMARFQEQIIRQQADGLPMTDGQKRYFYALSKAHKKINQAIAK